jgi:ABC-type multidrug transport system ATPase subunit
VTDPVVSLADVRFAFGDLTVVDGVTLDLGAGQVVAFVGPNGSGKTTFLELVAGLRSPDSGAVTRPTDVERSVAYLPQSPRFRSGFTARETVAFYAGLVDADVDAVALLERVGLGDAANRRVEALSGGMTRLLGIAQALVGDPPVVVFDEPTSGLDPDIAERIFDVVVDLAADGRTVVVASHDLPNVEDHADRVLLLSDGLFRLDGSPAAVREETGSDSLREAFSKTVRGQASTYADRDDVDADAEVGAEEVSE